MLSFVLLDPLDKHWCRTTRLLPPFECRLILVARLCFFFFQLSYPDISTQNYQQNTCFLFVFRCCFSETPSALFDELSVKESLQKSVADQFGKVSIFVHFLSFFEFFEFLLCYGEMLNPSRCSIVITPSLYGPWWFFVQSGQDIPLNILHFSQAQQTGVIQTLRKFHRKVLACAVIINSIDSIPCIVRILEVKQIFSCQKVDKASGCYFWYELAKYLDWIFGPLIDWLIDYLIVWSLAWLIDWLIVRLIGSFVRLIDWLICFRTNLFSFVFF